MNINVVYINNYMKYEFKDWKIHLHKHTDWGFERALSWRENGKRPKPNETSQMTLTTLKRLKTKTILFFFSNFEQLEVWAHFGDSPTWEMCRKWRGILEALSPCQTSQDGYLSNVERMYLHRRLDWIISYLNLERFFRRFLPWHASSSRVYSTRPWSLAHQVKSSKLSVKNHMDFSDLNHNQRNQRNQRFNMFQYVSMIPSFNHIQSFSTLRILHRDVPNLQDGEKQKRDTKLHRQNVLVTTSKQMV